jgi:hypothetical protein
MYQYAPSNDRLKEGTLTGSVGLLIRLKEGILTGASPKQNERRHTVLTGTSLKQIEKADLPGRLLNRLRR